MLNETGHLPTQMVKIFNSLVLYCLLQRKRKGGISLETLLVYVDLLFFYNFGINFFLLIFTAIACDRKIFWWRTALASTVGSLYVCLLAVQPFAPVEHLVFRLVVSLFMIFTAFRVRRFLEIGKLFILYYLLNFMLSGGIRFSATFVKGAITIPVVLAGVVLLFLFGRIYVRTLQQTNVSKPKEMTLFYQGKAITLNGFPDTGNTLVDPLEQSSVIVTTKEALRPILEDISVEQLPKARPIPCNSITDEKGVLWVFKPDLVVCEEKPLRVVVAVSDTLHLTDCDAVFNPVILLS